MPRSPDEAWDPDNRSTVFAHRCEQLDNYVRENIGKLHLDPTRASLQSNIDRVSAEADLFRILSTSAALESRTAFLRKLTELRASPNQTIGREVVDRAKYAEEWVRQVDSLLREYALP